MRLQLQRRERKQLRKDYDDLHRDLHTDLQKPGAFVDALVRAKHHKLKCKISLLILRIHICIFVRLINIFNILHDSYGGTHRETDWP